MIVIDGKKASDEILSEIKIQIEHLSASGKRIPRLVAILVGDNPASKAYVGAKMKACEKTGMLSDVIQLPASISEQDLKQHIQQLNEDETTDGFIVQLPLPAQINENEVIKLIHPSKDVDGFHPENLGKMLLGQDCFIPATPYGITKLIEHYQVPTQGKHVVVVGRSNIVGTPMSVLMSRNQTFANATVTLCHSKTDDISKYTLQADIIIVAIGKAHYLKANMVKPGAVVIDVGINRITNVDGTSKLTGDADYEALKNVCSMMTPVPGGVGPMTIAGLLLNTLKAYHAEK
jgi:methylenetetrahydrofolate dehydrogenase (NADP+) / methenyltetrahydrofolate cyclohydrolase